MRPRSLNDTDDPGGLAYSRRLFEIHGREFLESLGLLDVCSVVVRRARTSQNAGMDDAVSRDHMWGPYLTFLLPDRAWRLHGSRLKRALKHLPDRVEQFEWRGSPMRGARPLALPG